ncbi:hypothetical protein ACA040_002622 [Xenophilus aerolatus]
MATNTPRRYRYQAAAPSPAPYLHVSGVGLRVDHVPAGPLWERVQRQAPADEEAPEPPRRLDTCRERAGLFRSAALRAALTFRPQKGQRGRFVENYPVPTVQGLPPAPQKDKSALDGWSAKYRDELRWQLHSGPAAMNFHELGFKAAPIFETGGVGLWRAGLRAFDTEGDLNSLLLWAEDGYAVRSELGGWEDPSGQRAESLEAVLSRPKRPGQLRDTFSALLLTRPEAADWLREWSLHVIDASQDSTFSNGVTARGAHGFGGLRREAWDDGANYGIPERGFQPTPNVPEPWSQPQYEQYAQMPTLALLLRPEVVSFDAGMAPSQQADALESALRKVLGHPALLQKPPRRLFYSAAITGEAAGLLARCLARVDPQVGWLSTGTGFRLEQCLGGELGAASMNAALGLATIAVWESNEPALVVNLRDPEGAMVCALCPPDEAYRKTLHARPYVI